MSDRRTQPKRLSRDRGFTLIEVLIVITMIGFLSATLAAVFTVVVRTTPDAEQRITDARSLKGLVTWIPQDMDATPPGGFDDSHAAWLCAGSAPPNSHNVIAMSWAEVGDVTTEFHASYRYELRGSEWVIARYACRDAGAASRVNMTSALPPWSSTSPPAWVEMCKSPVDKATGDCPDGTPADPQVDPIVSMKVTLTLFDGTLYTIDAAAKNPDENLADDPDAVTNYPPTAGAPNYAMTMVAGEVKELELYGTHVVDDPEGDFLTSAVDSYETMPTGISVTASDPLRVTITADPSLLTGPASHPVALIISDAFGGSVEVTITIEIVLPPNNPPTAPLSPYTLTISPDQTVAFPLDVSHGVSDPNGDDLTLEVLPPWPASLTDKPEVGVLPGDLQMTVTVKAGVDLGPVAEPIRTLVTDERGESIEVLTYLNIVAPVGNNPPTIAASPATTLEPGRTATINVAATDPDPGDLVWAMVDSGGVVPAGLTVSTSGLAVTVTADNSIAAGTYVVPLVVKDSFGASVPVSATINIVLPPPPPPPLPCVLGTLSASPDLVGRSGAGQGAKLLDQDVLVTLTYSGNCDGLVLKYDTGHPSGLGSGVGRVFPAGSPTTVLLRGDAGGGSERWSVGPHVLTASTTSAVTPNLASITLTVN